MHKSLLTLSLLVSAIFISVSSLSAQQAQDREGTLLPDIDPQDIEIRSQYRARFPGLSRQPILGFTPGSRVFQVDPDRTPYFEDHEEIAAQLPVGELDRPEAPSYSFYPYADNQHGFARLGFGNHLSAEADVYLSAEVADDHWISGGLNLMAGDDYLDQRSSYRNSEIDLNYRGKVGERTLFGAFIGGRDDFNYLIQPEGVDVSQNPGRKVLDLFESGVRLKHYRSRLNHFDIGVQGSLGTIDLDEEEFGLSSDLSQWGIQGDAGFVWAGRNVNETFRIHGDVDAGGYELSDGQESGWHLAGGHLTYQRLFNYRTEVDLTAGVYHGSDSANDSRIYFAPDLLIEHYFSDHISLMAQLEGRPEQPGHLRHHQSNRFLLPGNHLQNSYSLKATSQLKIEPIYGNQIRVGAAYETIDDYAWYRRSSLNTGAGSVNGHYLIEYSNVTIPRGFAGLNVELIQERVWFDVEGYLQMPRISDDQKVPYKEEYGLNGAVTVRPFDPLLFEVWGQFAGPRETSTDRVLPAHINLGTKLELKLTNRIGVYGKMMNLLQQDIEMWDGYLDRPFMVYGGLTLHL
jgi:hypothetical protein